MALKIVIEGSRTPIYRRMISGLSGSLEKKNHQIITCVPGSESPLEYVRNIDALKPDLVIIPNLFGLLSAYSPADQQYFYELQSAPIAFLHYDNVLGPISDWEEIQRRYTAFIGNSGRSRHFCIENNNISDFHRLQVGDVKKIYHASEFGLIDNGGKYRYDISFVGHLLPEPVFLDGIEAGNLLQERVLAAYRKRRECLDHRIEEDAMSFSDLSVPSRNPMIDWLTAKQVYRARINGASLCLRGSIITDVADSMNIDVIGGDPSYINNRAPVRQLKHAGVRLHMPDRSHEGTDEIYARTKININITSIQFDSAIVNRVLDVAAVGGFLLTDWKEDLREITPVFEQISYRSVDELKNKIDYYLTHDAERREIASQLHMDVTRKLTYDCAVSTILDEFSGQT